MKYLTTRKLVLFLFIAGLFAFFYCNSLIPGAKISAEPKNNVTDGFVSIPQSQERVIYICRVGAEEIPAVQISEIKNAAGQVIETIARVQVGEGIEVSAQGVAATWDYKSISARSGGRIIDIVYKPNGGRKDYDWILTLSDNNTMFKERVRDCQEVSDE